MKDFRLALVAHASPLGHTQRNLDSAAAWARKARQKGADLVCLPELNITGHGGHKSMIADAQRVPGGQAACALERLARELNVHLCAGIAEADGGAVYNTQFIVGPGGFVGKQRKVHLSSDEYFLFRGGTDIPVFDLPFARVGVVICYDNELPEMARCCAVQGAELILSPHAARFGKWPATPRQRRKALGNQLDHWRRVHQCRAMENGVYVGLCNTAGRSAVGIKGVMANHAGGCLAVGPTGDVIAQSRLRDIGEEMLVVDLKAQELSAVRQRNCFNLRTRRVEAFRPLTAPTA